MRKICVAASAIASLAALAAPAAAAVNLSSATGTPLVYTIHNNHGVNNDSTSLAFDTTPAGYVVDYMSGNQLHYNGQSGGFAFVTGENDVGFGNLTVSLEGGHAFSAFKFNFDIPAKDGPVPNPPQGYQFDHYQFLSTVNLVGGGIDDFTTNVGNGNGNNRYVFTTDAGDEISSIAFTLEGVYTKHNDPNVIDPFNFGGIRQASFDIVGGAVPEPATWAMFILGFGFVGAMLRMARSRQAVTA